MHTNLSCNKDKDATWDLVGDEHDSMESSNIDMLDLSALFLDELTLERMTVYDEMESGR